MLQNGKSFVIGNRRWRRRCKIKVWSICVCLLVDVDLSEYFALSFRVLKTSSLLLLSDNYKKTFICTNSYNTNKQTKLYLWLSNFNECSVGTVLLS